MSQRRITKLLVANRGEIARRVFRAARSMGIATVAVYADPDSSASFVREADEAVPLHGQTATETYLDIQKLLGAARATRADAVHPGYGFLAESAAFARAVEASGRIWVGPSPESIAAMGDKLAAKRIAIDTGVPTLDSVPVDGLASEELALAARRIGYPLLVKAAAGGGGKGMRVVRTEDQLGDAIVGARREARGAFADERVFLERFLESPRHVEIQILGDLHRNLVHCFERECSIQRRHQKIIEEAPSSAVDGELRRRMAHAALAIARAIGYRGAGTVEFILDGGPGGRDSSFYFLEVNTRLQVEHPVTEAITGLDLVREQLRIAEGERLSLGEGDLRVSGHAIEARLYAEDPENDFLPQAGRIIAWAPPADPLARIESGVEPGCEVPSTFDPMLAKLIVHAPTRAEAAARLALVLERLVVHGITTNRDLLVSILRHPSFLDGDTTTDFIERHAPARSRALAPAELHCAAIAAALGDQAKRRAGARALATLPSGWRNNPGAMQSATYSHRNQPLTVTYQHERDGVFRYQIDGQRGQARLHDAGDRARERARDPAGEGTLDLEVDGVRRTLHVSSRDSERWVHGGSFNVRLDELPRFPEPGREQVSGGYLAPMPGKVIEVLIEPGRRVTKGETLVVMEAMKMEHRILCIADGAVGEVRVRIGSQVELNDVLLVVE